MKAGLPKAPPAGTSTRQALLGEIAVLLQRLTDSNETLRAIRNGEVDAVVVAGKTGPQVFTLGGAEQIYRELIESMNEGALTLTPDKMILYANRCFAGMTGLPLEKVIGGSLGRFLSERDRAALRLIIRNTGSSGAKLQTQLVNAAGTPMPVQFSIRALSKGGTGGATIGIVVTDLTEARRVEESLRALNRRIVQVQEDERGRIAGELHDNITQLICSVIFRSQVLADKLTPLNGTLKLEAVRLREMLGKTAFEVERISHNLGPHVLDHLGFHAAMGEIGTEFQGRTGVSVKLACSRLTVRLPTEVKIALYRIIQEALRNVEKHASARNVNVHLECAGALVSLTICDDGIGFNPVADPPRQKGKGGLGLLSMKERAAGVGGDLTITSAATKGTRIEVRVPVAPARRGPAHGPARVRHPRKMSKGSTLSTLRTPT